MPSTGFEPVDALPRPVLSGVPRPFGYEGDLVFIGMMSVDNLTRIDGAIASGNLADVRCAVDLVLS